MFISVITINLNNAEGLVKTIDSIRIQTNKNYELIIIDGKSTDESVSIIERNKDIIFFSISELDNGIYYAMNKGLDIANGDFVIFLNSGDSFYDDTILKFVADNIFDLNKVYFGSAQIFSNENTYYLYPSLDSDERAIRNFLKYYKPCHQAMFFPRIFFTKNKYNVEYNIFSDVDYKIRALKLCGYIFFNKIIVCFMQGGFSSTNSIRKAVKMNREYASIYKINSMYSIKNHIKFVSSLLIKYFFYLVFKNKAFLILTKIRSWIK